MFVPLILKMHWQLDIIGHIVGVLVLSSHEGSIRVDGITLFVSAHSPFACFVLPDLGSFNVSGLCFRACLTNGKALAAGATIVWFDRKTAFTEKFAI